jgi:hypothetical protein
MTPQQTVAKLKKALTALTANELEDVLYFVQYDLNKNQQTTAIRARPIGDAADQVAAVAEHADAMLSQLEAGWLWKLITQPTENTEQSCPIDATQTKRVEPCPHPMNSEQ